MYEDIDFSPDGKYIMLTTVSRPFSYIVPYYRFPSTTAIYDLNGNLVETIVETPLLEELPKGFMATQKGKRRISWRGDKPSTIYWVEALDEGDPEVEVEYRDVLYQQDAPFKEEPRYLLKVKNRYAGMYWGNDNTAIALDRWWNNRNTKSYFLILQILTKILRLSSIETTRINTTIREALLRKETNTDVLFLPCETIGLT
ncbi:MAG: hypothetical protein R2784_02495 [Saprospiraceae bacterium]